VSVATSEHADSGASAWHAIAAGEVVKRLATNSEKGLDAAEAAARLAKHGPNRLPEGKKRGPFKPAHAVAQATNKDRFISSIL
jgi:magnesium-transporting ATPase (P-type)